MISLEKVSYSNIITDINLSIERGSYIGIAGPNGSGKSTLARIIKGLEQPSSGNVYIDGEIRSKGKVSEDIGLILGGPENQLVSSSIEEDAAFGLENMNIPSQEIARRTEDALKWASLWELRDIPAHHLSAGQQQMLVLAGIMAMQPRYLILDEATSVIDPSGKTLVLEAGQRMNREMGVGIIHISHDLNELMVAKTIFIMDNGNIAWSGPPSAIHHQEPMLSALGMELPQILKLKSLMIKDGYPLDEKAVTIEDIAEEIVKAVRQPLL